MPQNKLLFLKQVNVDEVKAIVHQVNVTYCHNDPLPISDTIHSDNLHEILTRASDCNVKAARPFFTPSSPLTGAEWRAERVSQF